MISAVNSTISSVRFACHVRLHQQFGHLQGSRSFSRHNVVWSRKTTTSSPNEEKDFDKVGPDAELSELAQQYPHAHGTLNNIMAAVAKELKNPKSFDVTFTPEKKSQHLTGWTCSCKLQWPSMKSFSATGKTKQEASRVASLKVLQWLLTEGKLKGNRPVLMDTKSVTSLKKVDVKISLDSAAAKQLELLVQKYHKDISGIVEKTKESAHLRKSLKETYRDDDVVNRISETQRRRTVLGRNRTLQRRAFERLDDSPTTCSLPIQNFKSEILKSVADNQVVIIKGEPGCGKSTQVPQYLLDEAAMAGRACDVNIIVTQPRRISAISLAERVSNERGEQIGDCVGYQVRFQSRLPRSFGGSIRFCSSGILLKIMQTNPTLEGFSHIIIDEAHERDVNTDMLLLLLRRNVSANPKLKVLIMSATINPELFQRYYPNSAALDIPGFTHPVESFFLEQIKQVPLAHTRMIVEQKTPRIYHQEVANLIHWIHKNKPDGAILCFLPGWQDIKAVMGHLERTGISRTESVVLPLHSRLSLDEQSRVFQRPPEGKRKIVLSTNVAETSVTIDDIGYVVDTGVHKEERLSSDESSAVLDDLWVSQANVNQRRGRAGRVRPGESYHLYTREKQSQLPMFPTPELHRIPLHKVVLDIKTYNEEERAEAFLSEMPEPCSALATSRAVSDLIELGALTSEEALTPLGRRIARFTTDPRLSKALIHAAVFRCLDPLLTITSVLSSDVEMFNGALDERTDIAQIKRTRSSYSDHISVLNLYNEWAKLAENEEGDEIFCIRNMLRRSSLLLVTRLRRHLLDHLEEARMLSIDTRQPDLKVEPDWLLSVLLSGTEAYLFQRNWDYSNGRIKLNTLSTVTESGKRSSMSSDCVCHKRTAPSPFLLYYKKQESAVRRTTVVRDASAVPPIALPLFLQTKNTRGDDVPNSSLVVLDDQRKLPFRLTAMSRDAELISETRDALQGVLDFFVIREGEPPEAADYQQVAEFRDELVKAVAHLVATSTHTS